MYSIQTVLILGAGTMGQMISQVCAEHGLKVHVYDIMDHMLEKAGLKIAKRLNEKIVAGQITEEEANKMLSNIEYFSDASLAAKDVDIISESVPEDPELKGRVFKTFHEICPPETIFTTNTSSLLPSQFAKKTGRPEKLCALHFHDTRFTNIVDVMPHEGTSPETIEKVTAFAKSIGQVPIVLERENNGYVFNQMLMNLLDSALTLAQRKVTSIQEIDKSWMGVMHTLLGPFGIMDSIGLDTVWKITDYWAQKTGNPQAKANAEFLKSYLDQGKKGTKTGEGFYRYPGPEYANPDFLK